MYYWIKIEQEKPPQGGTWLMHDKDWFPLPTKETIITWERKSILSKFRQQLRLLSPLLIAPTTVISYLNNGFCCLWIVSYLKSWINHASLLPIIEKLFFLSAFMNRQVWILLNEEWVSLGQVPLSGENRRLIVMCHIKKNLSRDPVF